MRGRKATGPPEMGRRIAGPPGQRRSRSPLQGYEAGLFVTPADPWRWIVARYSSPHRFSSSRPARPPRRESGQVLILSALVLPLLMGMAALAVDLGGYADHRRTLQNAADSIALAAARDLPDASAATSSAHAWADNNNIPWSDVTVTISPGKRLEPQSEGLGRHQPPALVCLHPRARRSVACRRSPCRGYQDVAGRRRWPTALGGPRLHVNRRELR